MTDWFYISVSEFGSGKGELKGQITLDAVTSAKQNVLVVTDNAKDNTSSWDPICQPVSWTMIPSCHAV